jgi:threonine synthase
LEIQAALLQAVSWRGVEVIILYPSGKVSDIQERQLTTLGQNIKALEVDGVLMMIAKTWLKKAF